MSTDGCTLVVGGTAGIGEALARHYAGTGRETVLTGRGLHRAQEVAAKIGGSARGETHDDAHLLRRKILGKRVARGGQGEQCNRQ